eukprot:365969-Chlamydomonas_euryale.AAC.6
MYGCLGLVIVRGTEWPFTHVHTPHMPHMPHAGRPCGLRDCTVHPHGRGPGVAPDARPLGAAARRLKHRATPRYAPPLPRPPLLALLHPLGPMARNAAPGLRRIRLAPLPGSQERGGRRGHVRRGRGCRLRREARHRCCRRRGRAGAAHAQRAQRQRRGQPQVRAQSAEGGAASASSSSSSSSSRARVVER